MINRLGPALLAAAITLSMTGCGSDGNHAASATPSPKATPDQWAIKTCTFLGKQDPSNGYANEFALQIASTSTMPEFVDLATKAKQAGDLNLIRAWCQQNYPQAGVTPVQPSPDATG